MTTEGKLYHLWKTYTINTDGMIPDKIKPRGLERVLHKAAFANAMRSNFTTTSIGAVMQMNHSTIVHYQRLQSTYAATYDIYNRFEGIAYELLKNAPVSNIEMIMQLKASISQLEKTLILAKERVKKLEEQEFYDYTNQPA